MPVNGSQFDPRLLPVYLDGREALGDGRLVRRPHPHRPERPRRAQGHPEEILGGLDAAGHQRALVFAMHEPDGYRGGQRRRPGRRRGLRRAAWWRSRASRRNADGRARRGASAAWTRARAASSCTRARTPSACRIRSSSRSSRWPTSAACPVLFHAGRGIPHLGEAVVDLARRYPGARLILAHAGISDLGWIADEAAALQNLFFDTAWWNVADQLQLYATIPPGPDPLRERHALRAGAARRLRLPARRARGRPRARGHARDRRRAARARRGRGGARSTSARRRAPTPSGRA